jgi:hypothetical protein
MLRLVRTSNCIVYTLTAERRVNHYRLATKGFFDLLQQLRQALQVTNFFLCWAVVKLTVVGDGQFVKGKVFT